MNEIENFWNRNRLLIKGGTIAVLTLLLLIPSALITSLIYERQNRQEEARKEVSSHWASSQALCGPVLVIPYVDTQAKEEKKLAYFLPQDLIVNGSMLPEKRYRGIYEVMLYRSEVTVQGSFAAPDLAGLKLDPGQMLWKEAYVMLGLTDLRGVDEQAALRWNDTSYLFDPGLPSNALLQSGMQVSLTNETSASLAGGARFSFHLLLKGSQSFDLIPVGKTTQVKLRSSWPTPSFTGEFLPSSRSISAAGFGADWKVYNLNRNYPQAWKDVSYDLLKSAFGVSLMVPVDMYQKTMRCVKYAILFIALTFLVFFLLESVYGGRVHPFQYLLIGLALCIFYVLLLSISEFLHFVPAYIIASSATAALISVYTLGLFKKRVLSLLVGGMLLLLYGFIFILIQLEDFALLMGSIGLFIILGIVMYFSRKIDWYQSQTTEQPVVRTE